MLTLRSPFNKRPLVLLLLLHSLLSTACSGNATARSIVRAGLHLELIDDQGQPLPTYHHRGHIYVQGDYGERYQIRVRNRSDKRRELVVTVDGRDVINGQVGSYSNRGYVVDPYGTVTIQGFRKSDTEVATFRFTSPSDSYSGRMGTKQHVGVIGVALFEERPRPRRRAKRRAKRRPIRLPPPYPEMREEQASSSVPMMNDYSAGQAEPPRTSSRRRPSAAPQSEIGTQYGEGRYSEVEEVKFRRRSTQPERVFTLHYDSEEGLIRRGVISEVPPPPSAFPDEPRYAPPPP